MIENNGAGVFHRALAPDRARQGNAQEQQDLWASLLDAQRYTLGRCAGSVMQRIFADYKKYWAEEVAEERGCTATGRVTTWSSGAHPQDDPCRRADMCIVVHSGVKTTGSHDTHRGQYRSGEGPGECLHRSRKQSSKSD